MNAALVQCHCMELGRCRGCGSPEYRMNYAQAVAARGKYAEASRLLDPLAYSPRPSGMRDAALALKKRFDAEAIKKKSPSTVP